MKKIELDYEIIRNRIITCRKARGLKSCQLADKVGTTSQTISNIETGRKKPSLVMIYRIAEALECPVYSLLPASLENEKIDTNTYFLPEEIQEMLKDATPRQRNLILSHISWAMSQKI